jgi:glycosyltransferase involved in cell wall biosynthesis
LIAPKVLHVVESLDRGAIENWLLRMLRHARRRGTDVKWTFYCAQGTPGAMEREARALNAGVVASPTPLGQKVSFIRALRAELLRGRYDVLHCHHDLVSAVYLLSAARIPIRRRIVHVHNADEGIPTPSRVKQRLFREPLRRICLATADRVVGNSNHTLDTFLAGRRRKPGRDTVHYYGVDPTRFQMAARDRSALRRSLGLPEDALILLFAGRMTPEKNPVFAVDVLAALRAIEPRAVGVFAGAGSLEPSVTARARRHGIDGAVRQLGWRDDVPEIMGGCDWFVLPHPEHPMEGFGLAVVEAQLAGLRLLLSRGIADDPLLPAAVFSRLPLAADPEEWARAAMELLQRPAPARAAALAALRDSPMDLDRAAEGLRQLHA